MICHLKRPQLQRIIIGLLYSDMSTFVSNVSPTTGRTEWIMQSDDYDYTQEVARSAYADMLHDEERNNKYYRALKQAINIMKSKGKEVHVIDIGTGTGLLSMMAARCGADTVTAVEAFRPMAECALKIIEQNGHSDKIKLIQKRSTDVTVGPEGDMKRKANILVTEVFDTELIGEGAHSTFQHAHDYLLEKDCFVIPRAATMYAQLVESDLVYSMHHLQPVQIKGCDPVKPPIKQAGCTGAASLHDLQLDQLPSSQFRQISDTVPIFEFDFSGKERMQFERHNQKEMVSQITGKAHAVFMWWDLVMDPNGEIILSCAPRWAHPEPETMPWRDHWMQAIYYLQSPLVVNKGDEVCMHGFHDEYSLWFHASLQQTADNIKALQEVVPTCICGLHVSYSHSHIGQMNDPSRRDKYFSFLDKFINKDTVCLNLTDGTCLPFAAASLGCKKVFTFENSVLSSRIMQTMIDENGLKDQIAVLKKPVEDLTTEDLNDLKVDLLIGEPCFLTSLLPWHNLYFWYARTELSRHLSPEVVIMPGRATLKAIGVHFKDLWKIRAPVGICEGFNIQKFDELILKASDDSDAYVEPQPLWEYPCTAMTDIVALQEFDFTRPVTELKYVQLEEGTTPFSCEGVCNGVAVWMDWHLDDSTTVTTGPTSTVTPGCPIQWDMFTRQGVHLFRDPRSVKLNDSFSYKAEFTPGNGDMNFKFELLV